MAKFCIECGKEIADGVAFCTDCGTPAPMGATEQISSAPPVQTAAATAVAAPPKAPPQSAVMFAPAGEVIPGKGSKYESIGTGGYIGIILLLCIPIIGQILTIVWACGGCQKVNKRNFARAMLVFFIVSILLGTILYFVGRTLWTDILQSSGLGELMNEAGGLGELSDVLGQLGELNGMMPVQ